MSNIQYRISNERQDRDEGALRNGRVYDLEERLIEFAVQIMNLVEELPNTRVGTHVGGQLLRCGTSPAPNYAEAKSAESRDDFIHKMKICLKELPRPAFG